MKLFDRIKKGLGWGEYKFKGFVPGELYSFRYNPKYEKELLFYDGHPLIIYLSHKDSTHIYGLNIHFLPMKLREKLFREFEYRSNDGKIIPSTLLKGLNLLKRLFPVIIRMYIVSRISGKILRIPPTKYNMEEVKDFPTEKFYKLSPEQIFSITMRQYRKTK